MITPTKFVRLGGTITMTWTKDGKVYEASYNNTEESRIYVGKGTSTKSAVFHMLVHRENHKRCALNDRYRNGKPYIDVFTPHIRVEEFFNMKGEHAYRFV